MNEEACELLIDMHVWATARSDLESAQASAALKEQVGAIIQMEDVQGIEGSILPALEPWLLKKKPEAQRSRTICRCSGITPMSCHGGREGV